MCGKGKKEVLFTCAFQCDNHFNKAKETVQHLPVGNIIIIGKSDKILGDKINAIKGRKNEMKIYRTQEERYNIGRKKIKK